MNKLLVSGRKFLKSIDAFGSPITFNIDGSSTYQSGVGGFMTLSMIIIIIIFFESQIANFFNRDKIYVSNSQSFDSNPRLLNLEQNDFMFAIGIEQDKMYPFPTNPYYNIEMLQNVYIHEGQNVRRTNQSIPLEPCTLARFKQFKGNYQTKIEDQYLKVLFITYFKFGFSNFLCPAANFNFSLQGSFLNQEFQFVTIRIMECKNSTNPSSPVCAPKHARDEYLLQKGAFRLSFYTTNYVINAENKVEFSQLYIAEDLNFQFQPGYQQKIANIYFRNYQVDTDEALFGGESLTSENFIFRGESSLNLQSNEDLFQDQTLTKSQKSQLGKYSPLTLYLRSDYFTFYAKRKFMKVDELLSYFGGIFQLFLLIFGVFMHMYNQKFFLLRMANKLYDLQESDEHNERQQKSTELTETNKIKNLIQSNHLKNSQKYVYGLDVKVKSNEEKEEDLKQKARLSDVTDISKIKELGFKSRNEFLMWYFEQVLTKKLKLRTSFSYISYILTFKYYFANNRNKLIDKAIAQVSQDMNIKSLMNQVQQIDKLKRLVLSSNQIILFNFFPKPELNLNKEKAFDLSKMNSKPEDVEHTNLQSKKPIEPMKTNVQQASEQITNRLDYKSFSKLLQAFDQIVSTNSSDETTQLINSKLIHLLGTELRTIFKTSLLIQDLDQNEKQVGLLKQSIIIDELEDQLKDEEEELQVIRSKYLQSSKLPNHPNTSPIRKKI